MNLSKMKTESKRDNTAKNLKMTTWSHFGRKVLQMYVFTLKNDAFGMPSSF